MRRKTLFGVMLTVAALGAAGRAGAEDPTKKKPTGAASSPAMGQARVFEGDKDLTWGAPPPGLPSGAELAVLDGDPGKAGAFTVRVKMPSGYKIMPHTHPTDEKLTIIKGDFQIGHGAKFDEKTMTMVKSGGFINLPTGHQHYAMCKSSCEVQINSMGPFVIDYVNPSDDPRKARAER